MENTESPSIDECMASLDVIQSDMRTLESTLTSTTNLLKRMNGDRVVEESDACIVVDGSSLNMGSSKQDREIVTSALLTKMRNETIRCLALSQRHTKVLDMLLDCLEHEEESV